jgi:PAS domain S-box-containing protein
MKSSLESGGAVPSAGSDARRLQILIEAMREYAIHFLDRDGLVASWNAGAERITGYQAAEIVGRNFAQLFTEEDRHRRRPAAALAAARREGRFESEGWRARKDGSRFRAQSILEAERDASGAVTGFVEIVHNLDEPSATGSADSERSFRLLVESITDYAIFMLDPSGIVISWNPGAEKIKGYQAHEIVGRHFGCFYTEEDRKQGAPERALSTAAREGRFEQERWRVRKDGSRFWASVVIDPIRDSAGQVQGFAKITRDMTARQHALEELKASERQFRLLVNGVVDYAIFMLDPNGIVTNWNAGAERIKGYKAAEIVGHHFSRFYSAGDRAAGVPTRALEQARRHGRYDAEGWRLRKDGSRFWASVVIDAISEHGQLVGFAKITRDISERRHAEEALERAREQLAQAQKMETLGQLTGGIAHDFNNLLMVIGGRTEVMRRRTEDPAILAGLDAIESAAQKGGNLTRQLLAFSRRQALRPTVVDLREWLPQAVEMLRPSLRGDIDLQIRISDDVWPVEVDTNELELALLNIAVNARDAMPTGGLLILTAANEIVEGSGSDLPAGDFVRLAVSDTGEGIPPELLARVFEPFFTTKEVGKGTGLGLSQVYGFATQSGGTARISSRVGEGATVTLHLPRTVRAITPEPNREPEAEAGRASARILFVEDNEEVAEVTGIMLRSLGHEVVHAPDAKAALEIIETERFDLVISDIVMPGGMSGIELAQRLLERPQSPPVLLITGYSSAARDAARSGLTILSKPFQIRALDLAIAAKLAGTASARHHTGD